MPVRLPPRERLLATGRLNGRSPTSDRDPMRPGPEARPQTSLGR